MTRINLVIADIDEMYLDNLAGFMFNKYYSTFKIKTFSSRDLFIEFLKEKKWNSPDLILLGDEFSTDEEIQKLIGTDSLGLIGIGVQCAPAQNPDMLYIEKYQSAETITEEIVEYYTSLNPVYKSSENNERSYSKVISMFSSSGGAGKSTIAVNLANQLSSFGKRVLYLDLQSLNTTFLYYGDTNKKFDMNFTNLIFSIKENSTDIKNIITNIVVKDDQTNVFFIPPPYFSLEIDELTAEDYEDIIHELKVSNIVDYIVIDTETGIKSKNITIFKHSDFIINIENECLVSSYKNQVMKCQELRNDKKINIIDKNKIINIKNNMNSKTYSEYKNDISEDSYLIPFIPNIYQEKDNKISINNNEVMISTLNEIILKKKLV
ncbi:MAG TPA: AAA family ATPase [Candidatus Paceibacterota bacterium]